MAENRLYCEDNLETLATMEAESVDPAIFNPSQ